MNHSKRGLNEPFYKWLDDVRRAIRKEKELQEKLQYYNVKLIGYKGVVYDRIGSSSTAVSDKDILFWIDRMDETLKSLELYQLTVNTAKTFSNRLSSQHQIVFWHLIGNCKAVNIALEMEVSSQRVYQVINDIISIWRTK